MPAPFSSLATFRSLLQTLPQPDAAARAAAQARDAVLTKPAGSLGRLEEVALWVAGWQGRAQPRIEQPLVLIFAGNHGVTARGVSAFPAEVTVQMVANFRAGGAAINQLARTFGARMEVHALDLDHPVADFTARAAMTEAELSALRRCISSGATSLLQTIKQLLAPFLLHVPVLYDKWVSSCHSRAFTFLAFL